MSDTETITLERVYDGFDLGSPRGRQACEGVKPGVLRAIDRVLSP